MSTETAAPYRLHVAIDRGQGPIYVLLHGINSTGHDWDTVVTAMGFDHRCIALDELGYGDSPHPIDIEYTVDDHADAIQYTLQDMGIAEQITLVGYSMGGPMAVRYAAKYPALVKRLVLISAPFYLDPEEMGAQAYAKAVFQSEGSQAALKMASSVGFEKSGTFKKLSSEDKHVIQDFINAQDLKTDWAILQKNVANSLVNTNFSENLSQVTCPITFMVGEHDAFIVQSQIETLAEKYAPNMEIRFLADLKADHMLLLNVPTMMAGEITKYEDRRLSVAFDRGEGDLILMLHGVENDGSFWNQVAYALASRDRAVALDLLGFGQSPRPADIPYTVDDHITSIELTLESLLRDPDQRLTIVGHSLGAIIGAAFARKHPDQVTRLVLFSVPINERDVEAGPKRLDQARAKFVDNFGALRERGIKLAHNTTVRGVLGRDRLQKYLPTLRSLAHTIEDEQVGSDLKAVPHIPVVVVHGDKDPFVVPEYIEHLETIREGIEVVRLEGVGHDIAAEKPAEAALIIDPELDPDVAAKLVAQAAKDPKLRPAQSGWSQLFREDMPLVIFRAILYLALGLTLLLAPAQGDVRVLRLTLTVFIFARSISFITSVFTTTSIQQEKITNAASGLIGIVLGIFLMLDVTASVKVLGLFAAGYLVLNAAIDLFAAFKTTRQSSRRPRLLAQGIGEFILGALLLVGSVAAARLVVFLIMAGSIAAGAALLTFVLVTVRMGKVFSARLE